MDLNRTAQKTQMVRAVRGLRRIYDQPADAKACFDKMYNDSTQLVILRSEEIKLAALFFECWERVDREARKVERALRDEEAAAAEKKQAEEKREEEEKQDDKKREEEEKRKRKWPMMRAIGRMFKSLQGAKHPGGNGSDHHGGVFLKVL